MLVATVCSSPPEGRKRWTLDLLAGQMVQLTEHEGLSRETVRRQSVIVAGRKVIVQRNAISMPVWAISPSSATPLNAVGTNARNPAAVASAATIMAPPGASCGEPQRFRHFAGVISGLTETDRELKREVHGDPDEQSTNPKPD